MPLLTSLLIFPWFVVQHTCENLDRPSIDSVTEARAPPDENHINSHENHKRQNTLLLDQNICEGLR
jgi:hypothetical protein